MKAVSVKELKEELRNRSQKELLELCLRLSVFKKENKELLTYLLFESYDETLYIESVKKEIDEQFLQINKKTYYLGRYDNIEEAKNMAENFKQSIFNDILRIKLWIP